jgi:DNA-binding XRE family transcriptional regulator
MTDQNTVTLHEIRHRMGVSQAQMAEAMGLPLRTYEDIETGRSTTRPVHLQAARYASIVLALKSVDGAFRLIPDVRKTVGNIVGLSPEAFEGTDL